MGRNVFVFVFLFVAGISFSCKKNLVLQKPGDAQWIKVISDSAVTFTGKIRADNQNNLYCSYAYGDQEANNDGSAIIKLDVQGNVIWRKQFDSLTIYDFSLSEQQDSLIMAFASNEVVTLGKLSMVDGGTTFFGNCELPSSGISVVGMKLLITGDGYILSGTMSLSLLLPDYNGGFILKIDRTGIGLWQRDYSFQLNPGGATSITGCLALQDQDSFILVGSLQNTVPDTTSQFFVMKCDEMGNIGRLNFYYTSTYDGTYHGYYCATSDIVAGDDSFYYTCAFNVLFNTPLQIPLPISTDDDKSARIFRINSECDTIRSIRVRLGVQNQVADLVKKKGGGLFIGLNPNPLANFALIGKRNSFIANVSPLFTLEGVSYIQTQYTDYLGSVCAMPDGYYAIETMIQSLGYEGYKLQVVKTDQNGNF